MHTYPEKKQEIILPNGNPDMNLALRSTEVFLPDVPTLINGSPYDVGIDVESLVRLMNIVGESSGYWQISHPKAIVIDNRNASETVKSDKNGIINFHSTTSERLKPKTGYDVGKKGSTIALALPRSVSSDELTEEGLAKFLTRKVNIDLLNSVHSTLIAKRKLKLGFRAATVAIGAMTGEAVGLIAADNTLERVVGGTVGAVGGVAIAILGIAASRDIRYGKTALGESGKKAIEKTQLYSDEKAALLANISGMYKELFQKPIITLQPITTVQSAIGSVSSTC